MKDIRYSLKRSIVLSIYFLYALCSFSQEFIYKNFTTNHGLSSSEVYDIVQDKNGLMWFATDRGLTSYDGYEFKKYTLKDGLTDIVIFNFYEQADGLIWCSTFNKKLFYYNPEDGTFKEYPYNHLLENVPIIFTINDIQIDADQNLFITFKGLLGYLKIANDGSYENTLNRSKDKSQTYYKLHISDNIHNHFVSDTSALSSNDVIYLKAKSNSYYGALMKKDENLVVVTFNKDVFFVDLQNDKEQHIKEASSIIISGELDSDHFWIGLQHGGVKIYNYCQELVQHMFKDKSVTKVFKDHEGGLWISTIDSGVFFIENPSIKQYDVSNNNPNVYRLTKDEKNRLYLAFHNGEVYQYKNDQFFLICRSREKYNTNIQFNNHTKKLLINSPSLIRKNDAYFKLPDYVVLGNDKILSDNIDRTPISGSIKFYKVHDNGKKQAITKEIISKRIHDIEYSEGGYYIATFTGLFEYKKDSLYDIRNKHPLLYNRIDDIDYKSGTFYMATMGAGLVIMTNDSIFSIDNSKGLSSNLVSQVYAENDKEIFVATNSGLNRIVFDKNQITSIREVSAEDGLPGNEINDVEVIDNTVWVATKNGLYSFSKELFSKGNRPTSNHWLSIDSVRVNNTKADVVRLQDLSYNDNSVTVNYKAISFRTKDELIYRYRLKGLEKEWNITNNKEIKYPELPPGTYEFEVQVSSKREDWSGESKKRYIKIAPPFWDTWWFRICITLFLSGVFYAFFRFRILLYNKDVIRELLRYLLKKVRGESHYVIIKDSGRDIKLKTSDILYFKSSGNYLEIHTISAKYLIRAKIGEYEKRIPDRLEFVRIHRSYLVRLDKIQGKNMKTITINNETIPVGKTYKENLDRIIF